jgi:hypothetical protein
MVEIKRVETVFTSASVRGDDKLADKIETACRAAVNLCIARGISLHDPIVLKVKNSARLAVLAKAGRKVEPFEPVETILGK